jgi:hypothetical protein
MSGLNDFQSFAELLQHCFKLQKDNKVSQADALISSYITEAKRRESEEKMWSAWHLHQALGFRTEFAADEAAAEMELLKYAKELHAYFTSSLSEANARLAILHFENGNPDIGHGHALEAIKFSSLLGHLTPTVVMAATYDREHQASK